MHQFALAELPPTARGEGDQPPRPRASKPSREAKPAGGEGTATEQRRSHLARGAEDFWNPLTSQRIA